jgi:predicted nucleic acid-binding protein
MKYLADADVLSEVTKARPNPNVVSWLADHDADLLVTPIVLGELEYGILALPSGRRRKRLLSWFEEGITSLNILAIDKDTAKEWASLLADLKRRGKAMPVTDSLIAASARQHELTIATRNAKDYRHAGVKLFDPFG